MSKPKTIKSLSEIPSGPYVPQGLSVSEDPTGTTEKGTTRTVVQTATEIEQRAQVQTLAAVIVSEHFSLAEKYLTLCNFIRENAVPPMVVREELEAAGFAASRISEVLRVANVPPEMFAPYLARQIGFKKTLELSRAQRKQLEFPEPVEDGSVVTQDKRGKDKLALERHLKALLLLAEKLGIKSRKANIGNGWVVEVWKTGQRADEVAARKQMKAAK